MDIRNARQHYLGLARPELETIALAVVRTAQRLLSADDTEPADASRFEIIGLVKRAIEELSTDIDEEYNRHCDRLKGIWPTLDEPRERAINVVTSELDIDFLARRRKRPPLGDILRSPRYEVSWTHWKKAQTLADGAEADIPNAVKEGVVAVEALAKVVVPGNATLGDCIKMLRKQKRIDPGVDKILEGLWVYASASPGIRHGSGVVPILDERDWQIFKPMIDGALNLLRTVDTPGTIQPQTVCQHFLPLWVRRFEPRR